MRRALTDACTCSQDAFRNSALHYLASSFKLHLLSSSELESIVAKLLSLGADAALVDKVVAFLHVPHVHACPHHAPTNIRCPLQNVETYNVYLFSRIYCTSYT